MAKKILFMLICFTTVNSFLFAQSWKIGGNPITDIPTGGGRLGTNGARSVIFETNNIERARILYTNGFWGFGISTPNARIHINCAAGQNPLRVQVNGASKLYVDNAGGVSIGSALIPPANGLFVAGNAGLGTTTPSEKLHVVGNIFATGSIDVSGTVGFGSAEAFSDGGSFTILSNSDLVPNADNSLNLGTAARTWASVHSLSYFTTLPLKSLSTAENLKAGLPEIMKLRPISYTEGQAKKFGLVEKEVQGVLPEVTSDQDLLSNEGSGKSLAKTGKLSLEYDALIPVLIKGMQEQQKLITALQERITLLEAAPTAIATGSDNVSAGNLVGGVLLEQNQPNPFNQSTIIRYRLPQNASGQINIYDNNGKLVKNFKANESGQTTISAGELKSGIYTYTLSINGKLAATKNLVIVK